MPTTKQQLLNATAALALLALSTAAPAAAQTGAVLNNPTATVAPTNSAAALRAFWTPERMAIATPMRQVVTDPFIPAGPNAVAAQRGPTTRVPGTAPTEPYDERLAEQLYTPIPDDNEAPHRPRSALAT